MMNDTTKECNGKNLVTLNSRGEGGERGEKQKNISKSPPPHSASDKVFSLIFIQPFYAINLIW